MATKPFLHQKLTIMSKTLSIDEREINVIIIRYKI